MSTSVAAVELDCLPNRVRDALNSVRATDHPPLKAEKAAMTAPVLEAMRRANLSQKEFQLNADALKSTVSEALSGKANLPLAWLWAQPDAFWNEFVPLLAAAKQVTAPRRKHRRAVVRQIADLLQVLVLLVDEEDAA